jgi:16S rRNA (uracil1498-N3)-methyltransferase
LKESGSDFMHRLYVAFEQLQNGYPELSSDARSHLKVLRPRDGEKIELFDGRGHARECVFEKGHLRAVGELVFFENSSVVLTLFACVTKAHRWDWMLEKATELGVDRIVPVISERTIVKIDKSSRQSKQERWQKVVLEAVRQSGGYWVPEISEILDFSQSMGEVQKTTCFIGALTNPPSPRFLETLFKSKDATQGEIGFFVGPEGDFTPDELSKLLSVASPVSLGNAVLRAETAAILSVGIMSSVLK